MSYQEDYGIKMFYTLVRGASGFARDMQLRVTSFIVNGTEDLTPKDLIFARTANLPGKLVNTQALSYMGTVLQIPGTIAYPNNPWPINFYCLQNYNLRQLLERSMSDTYSEQSSTGNMEPRDLKRYQIGLSLLNDRMVTIREYTLHGAYVSGLDQMEYDATGNGAIKQMAANISYQYWSAKNSGPGTDSGNNELKTFKRDSENKYTNLQSILGL
jgi:hypothetical protein